VATFARRLTGATGAFARRTVADGLTLSRLPIGAAVVLLRRHRRTVAWLVALGILTDVADGPTARRLGTASDRGARLDSIADAALVLAAGPAAARTIARGDRRLVAAGATAVTATRLVSLLVTRRRFGLWSIAHTRLNKLTGLALATVTLVALARGRMPRAALVAVAVVAEAAALEELAVVVGSERYDRDRGSIRSPV
jgi:CDP-diacylglycerol--glycerol-3-phosphate 3-phosphatidyltransferase